MIIKCQEIKMMRKNIKKKYRTLCKQLKTIIISNKNG